MTTDPPPIRRVLIIDGHLSVGRGLTALVGEMPGVCVVGLATRGERGLAQAAEAAPDVALVDADLPGLCSEAIIRLLRSRLPNARIVALGIYPERKWTLLQAGAHEFVLKDAGYEALRDAIGSKPGGSGAAEQPRSRDGAVAPAPTAPAATAATATAATATACPTHHARPAGPREREERVLP